MFQKDPAFYHILQIPSWILLLCSICQNELNRLFLLYVNCIHPKCAIKTLHKTSRRTALAFAKALVNVAVKDFQFSYHTACSFKCQPFPHSIPEAASTAQNHQKGKDTLLLISPTGSGRLLQRAREQMFQALQATQTLFNPSYSALLLECKKPTTHNSTRMAVAACDRRPVRPPLLRTAAVKSAPIRYTAL